MTLSAILIVLALASLLFLFRIVRKRALVVRQVDDLPGRLRPVDLEAFRNLVDPGEEDFLRRNLTAKDFRRVQRVRLRAATEYVACAAANASILLRLGTAAAQSLDPRVAEAGRQLVDNAIRLRWFAFLAWTRLWIGMLLPGSRLSPAAVADLYQDLSTSLTHLGRVQYPTRGARISATL